VPFGLVGAVAKAIPTAAVTSRSYIHSSVRSTSEPNFIKMVQGYRDFIDYIATELQNKGENIDDEDVMQVLKECDEFVQVLVDIDYMLSQ
jgi:hypothetical protein